MINLSNEEIIHQRKGNIEWIQFRKLLDYPELTHCFTLKPLGFGDNSNYLLKEQEIINNYKLICNELRINSNDIVRPFQTHTSNVKRVENESGVFPENLKEVDGLITNKSNKILSLTFADCTPIYLWDPINKVIGNIHSGWKGTVQKIGKIAVEKMIEEYNCYPKNIICCIGPTIRQCHFEVQEDVKEIFEDTFSYQKEFCKILKKGKMIDGVQKYYIDTVKINQNLMEEAGLKRENIIDSELCTVCHSKSFHSYRAEGKQAGRNTALFAIKYKEEK